MADHLLRIRLKRGRNTHAARLGEAATVTTCGQVVVTGDTYLDGNPPIDCRPCATVLRRNGS